MYGGKDTGLERFDLSACLENGSPTMHDKIKALLHTAAVYAIFFLTDSFCSEIIGMVFRVCYSQLFIIALYTCLDILNVWIAVFLYSKYVLKMSLPELYLGKPFPSLRWCTAAIAVPFVADAVYFVFTKGEFKTGFYTQDALISILFHEVFSSGLRIAVTEGILFRGLLLNVLQKELGNKGGTLAASFFYAAASFIFYNSFSWGETGNSGRFLLSFLMGLAFELITCETGSVWSSVAVHFLYNALSGDAYILHIDAKQDFPAIFTYTMKSGSIFFTDMPLPQIAVFLVLIIVMLIIMKKEDGNHDGSLAGKKRRFN